MKEAESDRTRLGQEFHNGTMPKLSLESAVRRFWRIDADGDASDSISKRSD